jgi:peptidoglycan/LPS O-acetylase OafA/YrhL
MRHHQSLAYRPDIDGLRAIAVSLVLIFHLNPRLLRGGFVGVDVFFVISGYLIFAITRRELANGTFSLWQFYGRRIRRLFPALLLMLTTVLALGWVVMSAPEFELLGKHLAAAGLYLSNFVYWREAGYFDANSESKALLHLWSLAIEEQFYLVWPVLAAWLAARGRRFTPWTVTLAVLSLVGGLVLTSINRTAAFYFSPSRFWQILFGCVLALDLIPPLSRRWRNVAAATGLIMIALAVAVFTGDQRYPGSRALLPTLGTVLIIAAGADAWINARALSTRVLVWLGRISYPLYLWHWPVIVFMRLIAPESRGGWAGQAVAAGLSVGVAQLTHVLIELPALRLNPRRNAWWLMAPWLAVAAAGAAIFAAGGFPARQPELDRQLAEMGERPKEYYKNQNCPAALRDDPSLTFCRQSQPGTAEYVVIGDSHANHVFEGVSSTSEANWLVLGNPVCPPVLGIAADTGGPNCVAGIARMIRYVRETPSVRAVVISFLGAYGNLTDAAGRPMPALGPAGSGEDDRYRVLERGIENFVDAVAALGRPVTIAHDVPDLPFDGRDCIRRPIPLARPRHCAQTRAVVTERQRRYRAMMAVILARHPRITAYDPLRYLCDDVWCFAGDELGPLYFDRDHVGERGSRRAFGALPAALEAAKLNHE